MVMMMVVVVMMPVAPVVAMMAVVNAAVMVMVVHHRRRGVRGQRREADDQRGRGEKVLQHDRDLDFTTAPPAGLRPPFAEATLNAT